MLNNSVRALKCIFDAVAQMGQFNYVNAWVPLPSGFEHGRMEVCIEGLS